MALAVSPLAPNDVPALVPVAGVRVSTGAFGLRYQDRPDMLLVVCDAGTSVAGVFTQSTTAAAPVQWCRQSLTSHAGQCRALLVNAGQANAFTGAQGLNAARETAAAVAQLAGCEATEVMVASTGVIGQHVPLDAMKSAIATLGESLSADGWGDAAHAIRTTDTFAKQVSRMVEIGGHRVTIQGIAKGSGMIAPNMATMLGFMFTDANISPTMLQRVLSDANQRSFNSITVDGDTSTNDTVLAYATNKAAHARIENEHQPEYAAFAAAFTSCAIELAQLVVRDGEGVQKFIEVNVRGATSDQSAHIMAMAIANSPLIKTAIAGEDANWGRIVMAVGKTGEPLDQSDIAIAFGKHEIARAGAVIAGYDEAPVVAYMKGRHIVLHVSVGKGAGCATVWTCDLTHGYIAINADYRS